MTIITLTACHTLSEQQGRQYPYWFLKTAGWVPIRRRTIPEKQQMTHMVNRLVEQEFVERVYDPANRRIIKIKLADKTHEYIDHFVEYDAGCFPKLL